MLKEFCIRYKKAIKKNIKSFINFFPILFFSLTFVVLIAVPLIICCEVDNMYYLLLYVPFYFIIVAVYIISDMMCK